MDFTTAQIQQMISDALDQREKDNAFGVSLIPYHTHNGKDSPLTAEPGSGVITGITGTANEVIVSGSPAVTLSLPQAIATSSTPQFAKLGLNQAADSGAVLMASGQIGSAKATTTTTLDWNAGNSRYIVLANGGQTFTFANPKDGFLYRIILKQPSSGAAGTVTWPTISWVGGTAPTLTTANNKVDIITFLYDGTNSVYYGNYSQNY